MYCTNCGNALTDTMHFCPQCGTKVASMTPQDNDVPSNSPSTPTPPSAIPEPIDYTGVYEVIMESTSLSSNYYNLHKLLMAKNPPMGFFDRMKAFKEPTSVLSAHREEALRFAEELVKNGAKVTVLNTQGIPVSPEEYENASQLPTIPQQATSSATPRIFLWGCLSVISTIVLLLFIGIAISISKNSSTTTATSVDANAKEATKEEPATIPDYVKETSAIKPENERSPLSFPVPSFKAKIADGALHILPTKKGVGYDKTIARYGVKRIKKINQLLPKVAEWASYVYPPNETIVYVCVSDNKSTNKELVFFVDIDQTIKDFDPNRRLYVSEKDLPDKITGPTTEAKLTKLAETHKKLAVEVIKNALTNPETFQALTITCEKRSKEGVNAISIEFSAKNIHGYLLKYNAEVELNPENKVTRQDFTKI